LKVENIKVYDLEESFNASSFPMSDGTNKEFDFEKAKKRMSKLGSVESGSGHDCALKGILVSMDITMPQYWWMQFQRYHFADIVSSESKMHKILKFDIEEKCNNYVLKSNIKNLQNLINCYNDYDSYIEKVEEKLSKEELYHTIISNVPMGLELKARISTNYLQLKSIYKQRRNHKLNQWQFFCDICEKLPYFSELTGCGE